MEGMRVKSERKEGKPNRTNSWPRLNQELEIELLSCKVPRKSFKML